LWKFDTLKKHNPEVDGRSCQKTHKSKKVKSQPSQDKWIPRYEYDNIKEQTPKCVNSMHPKNNVQNMLSKKHKIPTVESRKSQIIQILEYETEINGS